MLRYAFLLREFVRRDFQARYAGSALGFVWSLLQPAWQLVLFGFVFSTVMEIPLVGERTENFGIFLFCGLMPWLAIHEGIGRASTAITDNANLVKKIHFPAEILVLSVVLGAVVHQLIAMALFVVVLVALGDLVVSTLPWLLVVLPLQIAVSLGIGLLAATAHTFLRDVGQLLGMILMGWFYVTPIVYPLSQVPEPYQTWVGMNPMTALVGLYRRAFLGGGADGAGLVPFAVFAIVALVLGLIAFRSAKPSFADVL